MTTDLVVVWAGTGFALVCMLGLVIVALLKETFHD